MADIASRLNDSGRWSFQCSSVDESRVPLLHSYAPSTSELFSSSSSSSSTTQPLVSTNESDRHKGWQDNVWPQYQWQSCPPQLVASEQPEGSRSEDADLLIIPELEEVVTSNDQSSEPSSDSAETFVDNFSDSSVWMSSNKAAVENTSNNKDLSSAHLHLTRGHRPNLKQNHHHHLQRQVLHGNGGVCIDGVRWHSLATTWHTGGKLHQLPSKSPPSSGSVPSGAAIDAPAFVDRLWRAFDGSFDDNAAADQNLDHARIKLNGHDIQDQHCRRGNPTKQSSKRSIAATPSPPSEASNRLNHLATISIHHARLSDLLNKSGWHYGSLSRQAAYGCLAATQPGTYLARNSSTSSTAFALSVQTIHGPTSIRLYVTCEGRVRLEEPDSFPSNVVTTLSSGQLSATSSSSSRDFSSVACLVDYYSRCGQLVLPAYGFGNRKCLMALRLTAPLLRRPHSLKHLCRLALNRIATPQYSLTQSLTPVLSASFRWPNNQSTHNDNMEVICPYARRLGLSQELLDYIEDYPCSC